MSITARYVGTALLAPSISNARGLFVGGASTETVLSGPSSAGFGQPVNLLVGVTSPWLTPFGTVEILRNTFVIAEAELDANGQASFQLTGLPTGANELEGRMVASPSFLGSRSNVLTITIGEAPDLIFRDQFKPTAVGQ